MATAAALLTRTTKPARRPGRGPREIGGNPMARDYERGPWPVLEVPPFPAAALELLERRTGQRISLEVLAEWERIRAFTGYQLPELPPRVAAMAALSDPAGRPPVSAAPPPGIERVARVRPPYPEGATFPDPSDLGDD